MESVLTQLLTTLGAVAVAIIGSTWFGKRMDKKDKTAQFMEQIDGRLEKIETKISDQDRKIDDLTNASVATIQDRFEYLCKRNIEEGHVTLSDLEGLKKLSVSLFKLDDLDGYYKTLLSKVEALPTKD